MRTITRRILVVGSAAAAMFATFAPVHAQYYYPPPPPSPGYGYPIWNGCPPNWTIQGGICKPYQGPVGGGWRTWNGCPPHYTIQGGVCKPYRGY
jgi:hypothetical protein